MSKGAVNESNIQELQAAVFGCEDTQQDGLNTRVKEIEVELNGNGEMGLKQKVSVMWRAHVWILCTLSGLVGSALTLIITKYF